MITRRRVLALAAFVVLEVIVSTFLPGTAPAGQRAAALPTRTPFVSAPDPVPRIAIAYSVGGRSAGYNELAWRGARRVADYFEAVLTEVNAEPGDTAADLEARLVGLGDARNGLVFVVGAPFAGPLAKVAPAYPDTWFGIVDDGSVHEENVVGILFNEEQGAFLVGAAAALTTDTGTLGFIGAAETSVLQKYEAGFVAGAVAVDPDVEVRVDYGVGSPSAARTAALRMYDSGVDVIFAATGDLTDAVIQAASDRGHWVIGADTDWYLAADPAIRDAILTSMVKHVDVATYSVGMETTTSTGKDGNNVFGVGLGAIGYATSGGFVDSIRVQLDAFAARIAAGEILVPRKP